MTTTIKIGADGRSGCYEVILPDNTDLGIREIGTTFTVTGSLAGALTATIDGVARVEDRGELNATICGTFTLDGFLQWADRETATATGADDALYIGSDSFTDLPVLNLSCCGEDGQDLPNLRRTHCFSGSIPTGFAVAPRASFNADDLTGSHLDTVTIGGSLFNESVSGTDAFTLFRDRYGTGKHAIRLAQNQGIRNTFSLVRSEGYTIHMLVEFDPSDSNFDTDRWAWILSTFPGIVFRGCLRSYRRGTWGDPVSGVANRVWEQCRRIPVWITYVVNPDTTHRMWVHGKPFHAGSIATPLTSVTNLDLIRRGNNDADGYLFVRAMHVVEAALTDAQVRADHDYFMRNLYADDHDLNGITTCYVDPDEGTTTGSGRWNDKVSRINHNDLTFSGNSSFLHVQTAGEQSFSADRCILLKAGSTVPLLASTSNGFGTPNSPEVTYPFHLGVYGSGMATIDIIDRGVSIGNTGAFLLNSRTGHYATLSIEYTSLDRKFSGDGRGVLADDLSLECSAFLAWAHASFRVVRTMANHLTHFLVQGGTATVDGNGQNFPFSNFTEWRFGTRNGFHRNGTVSNSGSTESSCHFLSRNKDALMSEIVGFMSGWDEEAIISGSVTIPWNSQSTNKIGLDNVYSHFIYGSGPRGSVSVRNSVLIATAGSDFQFRQGGSLHSHIAWAPLDIYHKMFDSFLGDTYIEGRRAIQGGNAGGRRGRVVSTSFDDPKPRRLICKRLFLHDNVGLADGNGGAGGASSWAGDDTNRKTTPSFGEVSAIGGPSILQFENVTMVGPRRWLFSFAGVYDQAQAYVKNLLLENDFTDWASLSGDGSPTQFGQANTTDIDIRNIAICTPGVSASNRWRANAGSGVAAMTKSAFAAATGADESTLIDLTDTGFDWADRRDLFRYCVEVLGLTDPGGDYEARVKALGLQWYEAYATAMRNRTSLAAFQQPAVRAWLDEGWVPSLEVRETLAAVDGTNYWGAVPYSLSASAPTVTDPTSTSIGATTATLGGNITDDGGDTITERGVVYALTATNPNPEIGGTGVTKVAASGTGTGVFTVGVTGLTPASGYSYKAYATNGEGTGYSDPDTFTTDSGSGPGPGPGSGPTFVRRVLGRAAGRLRSFRPALVAQPLQFLWWDDFRFIYWNNTYRASLAAHPSAYAPIITTSGGVPSNVFLNAPLWSDGVTQVSFTINPADPAEAYGKSYANAYLDCVRRLMGKPLDGSVPFCPYPNGWGYVVAEPGGADSTSDNWITPRTNHESLSRDVGDLFPATYLGDPVDPQRRGASGYMANGIASNYAWWLSFWQSAKDYIDAAVGHTRTPIELYDDCEYMGPNLNDLLRPISTGSSYRKWDLIKADARWDTELLDGTTTWKGFYDSLTSGERALLDNPANTSVFDDPMTLVAEKLGIWRNRVAAYAIDQSLVKAARDVFGSRLRFACEYDIYANGPASGVIGDRTSALLADRMTESRGLQVLPAGWGSSPSLYQLFGLRTSTTLGDLSKVSAALNFTTTGNKAQDGRLYNLKALVENVRRIRARNSDTVPWWTYNKYSGQTTNIVEADVFSASDHVAVLKEWRRLGVNRFILWGDPGINSWATDFGPAIDFVLPNL